MSRKNDCAPAAANGRGAGHFEGLHANSANPGVLLQRLDGVQRTGNGWRARCPACGGNSRKLSIAATEDRVLVHCFGCGDANAVLAAVGLSWAQLQPPRNWPLSQEERRRHAAALRECAWNAALRTLAFEAQIVLLASREVAGWHVLSQEDDERLALAVKRIESAARVLTEPTVWRPKAAA